MREPRATRGSCGLKCVLSVKHVLDFEILMWKQDFKISHFLCWLHVEMIIFWVYWIKYNILLAFNFACVYFYNVVTRKFKIPYVDRKFVF